MIFGILSLLGAVGALMFGLITGGVGGLIFWGLMMDYLTRTRVKAFFGKGRLLISPSYGLPYSLVPQVNQPQITTTNTEGHGRPAALGPPAGFPPVALRTSTSIPAPSNVSSTASSSSSSGKAPVCPYCHGTLPIRTRKCLTCGAAL